MSGNALKVDDIWPIVQKMPKTERLRLVNRLLTPEGDWQPEELADISDWAKMASPGDASLLDPGKGRPFSRPK